jgi:outer membrane protein TolC
MNARPLRIPLLHGLIAASACVAFGQTPAPGPLTIDLPQALARARQYGGQVQSANLTLAQATQDRVQARAATLPQASALSQYIYTEGNNTPSGVFVANDGVRVFTDQGIVHQDVLPLILHGQQQRAAAAEAVARAKVDVASRGLNAVVIQDFYAIANALRKLDNAALSITEARHFVDITQRLETGGEAAHADVVKAQSQLQQRQIDRGEAETSLAKAKIALAVLILPDFQIHFSINDDLDRTDTLPLLPDARAQAVASNPDVKAASATVDLAGYDVSVARYGYLPTVGLDFFYGLNANEFALHNSDGDRNIGAAAQITVNVPVWNWGATKSKVKQAELRQDQAKLDLSLAQRQLQAALSTAHAEAEGALGLVSLLRDGVTYATASLRLTLLRYQAGESTAFEVADAQSTIKQARDAYDDGLARYRVAMATLRTLMGTL